MNAMTPAAAPRSNIAAPILQPQTFDQLLRFAEMAATSDLMPRDYKGKPANIVLAVQLGSEVGLSPMQAIQNISVIQGRPAVWGDAMLGIVRRDKRCQDVLEAIAGEGEARVATCTIKRAGSSDTVRTFSVADAKRAGLWGKQGPWQQYPDRMMQMRARGFACRDAFPDVLRGLSSAEEITDIPAEPAYAGQTIDLTPERQAPARAAPADLPMIQTDALRDRTDSFIIKLAAKTECDMVRKMADWADDNILAQVREARRPDLDKMLTEAIAAARLRCPDPQPDAGPDGGEGFGVGEGEVV